MNARDGENRWALPSLKRWRKFRIELVLRIKLERSMMKSIDYWGSFTIGKLESKNLEETIIGLSRMLKCSMLKADKFLVLEDIAISERQKIFREWEIFIRDRFLSPQLKQLPNWENQLIKNILGMQRRSTLSSYSSSKSSRAIRNKKIWLDGWNKIKRK